MSVARFVVPALKVAGVQADYALIDGIWYAVILQGAKVQHRRWQVIDGSAIYRELCKRYGQFLSDWANKEEAIVLEEVLNEDKLADYGDQVAAGTMTEEEAKKLCMVWEWSVPSLGLGGYCLTREDAISDAKLCIGMQCPKTP